MPKDLDLTLFKKDAFFSRYPKRKVYNIYGGDPLCFKGIDDLLILLVDADIKVRLWINGGQFESVYEGLLPYVSEWVFYVPIPDVNQYNALVGESGWDTLINNLDYFKKIGQVFALNYKVTSSNIIYLPEMYEMAHSYGVKLYLHYDPKQFFDSESLRYIDRFRRVKEVDVYRVRSYGNQSCLGYPGEVIADWFQVLKNRMAW
mgnify:CR=1 FL=1